MDTLLDVEVTPFAQWEAGAISAREAATQIVRELIEELEPQEQALEERKQARRAELGTLLIRVGEPLEAAGRIARWIEPTTSESASVKKLRALIDALRDQEVPALAGIASRIAACITTNDRRGYPLIELPPRARRAA